jgi:hypothetical protein
MKNLILRDLMLQIEEIDETQNAFSIAYQIMFALQNDEITNNQYELLIGDLKMNCQRYKLPTANEICSLF